MNTETHSTMDSTSSPQGSGQAKNCQACKKDFVIEPEDFEFYKKIDVPAPTWCPQCRMIRRLSFLNLWNLYKRECGKCRKGFITIYSPDKQMNVYCPPCWWADDWDGTEYAMDYDASRPFLEQVKELTRKTPWAGQETQHLTNVNSDYANALAHCKNSYLIFWADYAENAYYSTFLNGLRDSLDCYRMKEDDLCYEDVGCYKCYRTFFSEECDSCTDVWFSRNCVGCTNIIGCVNLRNKSYHIFNKEYSKEEYEKKVKEMNLNSYQGIRQLEKKAHDFWLKHPRRVYTGSTINANVTGDYVYESKNAKDAYMVSGAEDCRYVQWISVPKAKNCYDYTGWGNGAELIYESSVCGEGASNVKFSNECFPDILNAEYCMYAISSKNVFGCVNLKRKEYCILNKQYNKEEYEKLVAQIKEDMIKNPYVDAMGREWKYGEFLPIDFNPFGYNESFAHEVMPKTKEEALKEGHKWHKEESSKHTITIKASELPDTIEQTPDSIIDEVIECGTCNKAYLIVAGELKLMKRMNLPLPHSCQLCRQRARIRKTNPPNLYSRNCAKCNAEISTSYAPERKEIVYCEQCYQAEVI